MAATQLIKFLFLFCALSRIQILTEARSLGPAEKSVIVQDVEDQAAMTDDSVEAALLNYLFAKQIMERLKSNSNPVELQQKRSYWKHCAFNAVTCFGK